jgi:hypothetical protein
MRAARSRFWVWLLTILLLALLAWVVGNHVAREPRAEVGVTSGDAAPRAKPSATAVEERAGPAPGDSAGELPGKSDTTRGSGGGGGGDSSGVPASPSPRR